MNLLDTFVVMFQADTSDIQRGSEEGGKAAQSIASQFEITADRVKSTFFGLAAAATGGLAAFSAAVASAVSASEKMAATADFALSGGVSTGDVQTMDALATKSGASIDSMRKYLVETKKAGKDAFKELVDVSKQMDSMSLDKALSFGSSKGLDPQLVVEMAKGSKKFAEAINLAASSPKITDEEFRQAREVSHLWQQVKASMAAPSEALQILAAKTSWVLKELLTYWKDFVQSPTSKELYKAIDIAALAIGNFWKMLKVVGIAVGFVYDKLKQFAPVILGIGAALAIAFMPLQYLGFGAIVAAIAGLLLVLDDVRAYFSGEKSILGDFLEEYPAVAAVFKQIGDVLGSVWDEASGAFGEFQSIAADLWEQFKSMLPTTDDLVDGFSGITDWIKENKTEIKEIIGLVGALLAAWLAYKAKGMIDDATGSGTLGFLTKLAKTVAIVVVAWKALKEAGQSVVDFMSGVGDKVASVLGFGGAAQKATEQIPAASAASVNSVSTSAISSKQSSKTNNVTIQKVEVQTQATDAAGISKAIGSSMQTQMRQATTNFDDGVLA